ncbi:MAG TPA: hypothetical protein VMV61_00795 [Patescibacteria group bacterium]|nr:hypothetical protein [Patescibacteria group bacterium]
MFLFGPASRAQDVTKFGLHLKDEVPVSTESVSAFVDPIRCDPKGDLYLRAYQPSNLFDAPIAKISREGKRTAVFSVASVSGFEHAQLYNFAVGLGGELYALVVTAKDGKRELDILKFENDGTFLFATKLGPVFTPAQLAVFPNGDFLVAGWKTLDHPRKAATPTASQKDEHPSPPPVQPFAAIIDGSGRLLTELAIGHGGSSKNPGGSASSEGMPSSEISLGDAVAGADGNIYLMLRTIPKPTVSVISAGGIVLRRFEVAPPSETAQAMAMKYVSGHKLIFEFGQRVDSRRTDLKNEIFSVVDPETGAREIDYQSSPAIGGAFCCYSPNDGFTFLGTTKDGQLVLRRVSPR